MRLLTLSSLTILFLSLSWPLYTKNSNNLIAFDRQNTNKVVVKIDNESSIEITVGRHEDIIHDDPHGEMRYFPDMPIQIILPI